MKTWCIYIDEAGVDVRNPQFIYATICVPFDNQQEFIMSYPEIVNPLVGTSGKEIKYGDLLNTLDKDYKEEIAQVCQSLLTLFLQIKDAQIIRVKAIRKQMQRKENDDLRIALFRKTLLLCKERLSPDHQVMILHDELPSRNQQHALLNTFNYFNTDLSFQNCVFVHSNENPFMQFADFVASICYRYYYFQKAEYKNKRHCELLVNSLFKTIDEHSPSIVELSEYTGVEGNPRKKEAVRLATEYEIPLATAYQIVDEKFTLTEVMRRKKARTSTEHRADDDKIRTNS